MNTSTRVEFGLYDVTARSDSAPVTEDAKDFCNLSKDLLLESVPNQNKYGTLETRQWLMDGSFLFFPETPRQYFWGFWSTEQSNGNGAFANPPVLNIRFDKNHSSSGLTLHFYSPTDDWASKVKIQWYDANDGLLAVTMFTPDAVDYYCAHKVENYRRIQLMFLETNKPGRYLKLAGIDYGVYLHFSGEEIIKAHVLEECDPLSAEVSINTLNLTLFNQEGRFSILNPEGYFDVLQHRQKLTVWEDVRRSAHDTSTTSYCMGTFYLDDWSNEDDTLADFTAIDTIGLLYDLSQDASTQAIADAKAFCDEKGIKYIEKNGTTTAEVQMAAEALIASGVKAVFTPTDNTVMTAELSIYETFAEAGVQHYTGADSFALNGAFVGYGVDYVQLGEATADMVVELLCDGKTPADLPFQTFDNGIATINTETAEALGLDLAALKEAFKPYCTEITEVTTAENFS